MPTTGLAIVRKEQSVPENYAHFYLSAPRLKNEIRVVLYNGRAIECTRHKRALSDDPCECMKAANNDPDKDKYWSKPVVTEDYSDLIDN